MSIYYMILILFFHAITSLKTMLETLEQLKDFCRRSVNDKIGTIDELI